MSQTTRLQKKSSGHTVIEMLISLAVILIISSVVLIRHSKFSASARLFGIAHEIALTVREAQVYGLAIREYKDTGASFDIGYGVHFDTGTAYILFADIDNDTLYTNGIDGVLAVYELRGGISIQDMCAEGICGRSSVDIVFQRPDPDAYISANGSGHYSDAQITLIGNVDNEKRTVSISVTGQISVY